MNQQVKILPSLLAADFGNLEAAARKAAAEGADGLHIDIMDGHFVPNLSMGPDVVLMASKVVKIPLHVHLMMDNPDSFIRRFIEAGSGTVLIHVEIKRDIRTILAEIRKSGAKAGITLNPDTPADAVYPFAEAVDEILCMTVFPGYGGQKFIPSVVSKIADIRSFMNGRGMRADLSVDGGINADTGAICAGAGANVLIAGASLFKAPDFATAMKTMRGKARNVYQ